MENELLPKVECCLCAKKFTNPRYLPSCLHTFCLKCIEDAGKMNGYSAGEKLPCPACAVESLIPSEGFDKLPENPFVAHAIEGHNEEFVSKTCEGCSKKRKKSDREGFEETVAENYCINCEESVCFACTEEHEEKNHLLVRMTILGGEDKTIEEQKQHLEEVVEVFCSSCKKIVCSHCLQEPHGLQCPIRMNKNKRMHTDEEEKNDEEEQKELETETVNIKGTDTKIVDHSSHNFSKLNECSVTFRNMAEINKDKTSDMIGDFHRKRIKVHRERMDFLEDVKKVEIKILRRSEEMKELICNEAKKLLTELATLKRARLTEIDAERRKMEKHLFTLEMFQKCCNEISNFGSAREVCRMDDTLQSTFNRMRNNHASRIQYGILPLQLSFSALGLEKFIRSDNNIVGFIEVVSPVSIQLASTIKQNLGRGEVRGISQLEDKLYVLSDEITVFQSQSPFTRLGEIKLQEGSHPVNIASCGKSSCLYVSDKTSACVWKITSDQKVSHWLSNDTESYSLSVRKSGQVIIAEGKKGQSPFFLDIYETHGRRSRRIPLPQEIKSIKCIYEAPSENVFIGYGEEEIFKLTLDGQMVVRLATSKQPIQVLRGVQCLQLADYHMFLAAALDDGNTALCVLDSKLAKHQVLWNIDQVQQEQILTTMCYIPEMKQLAIVSKFRAKQVSNVPQGRGAVAQVITHGPCQYTVIVYNIIAGK